MFDRKAHWEKIYGEKKPHEVSWYQSNPQKSLELIASTGISKEEPVIDVGGGASLLVDMLLEKGFQNVTVLDISEKALQYAQQRLGELEGKVKWLVSDITEFESTEKFGLWHDRAVFHFLTEKIDRDKYFARVKRSLKKGGFLILCAFAKDGPDKCSNLNVRQYDASLVREEFGEGFDLLQETSEIHQTPWGKDQKFEYFLLKRKGTEGQNE
jgi:ubiquinone/menaquinone biosynthesis C-methylase UbiE